MLSPMLAVSGSDDMAFRRVWPKPSMSGSGEPDASRSEPSSTTATTRSRHDSAQLRPIAATLSRRKLAGTAIFRLAALAGPSTMRTVTSAQTGRSSYPLIVANVT